MIHLLTEKAKNLSYLFLSTKSILYLSNLITYHHSMSYHLILLRYDSLIYVSMFSGIRLLFKSRNAIILHSSQRNGIRNAYLTSSISHDTNYLRVLKRSTAQFISPLKLFCMQYGKLTHIRT